MMKKGLWDFIIHVTNNQRIPEADSFFPSIVAHFEKRKEKKKKKYPGHALSPLHNVSRVRF